MSPFSPQIAFFLGCMHASIEQCEENMGKMEDGTATAILLMTKCIAKVSEVPAERNFIKDSFLHYPTPQYLKDLPGINHLTQKLEEGRERGKDIADELCKPPGEGVAAKIHIRLPTSEAALPRRGRHTIHRSPIDAAGTLTHPCGGNFTSLYAPPAWKQPAPTPQTSPVVVNSDSSKSSSDSHLNGWVIAGGVAFIVGGAILGTLVAGPLGTGEGGELGAAAAAVLIGFSIPSSSNVRKLQFSPNVGHEIPTLYL